MSDFVHLHVHSEYSMLDGLGKLPELVQQAKAHNQTALALTDHGSMYGSLHFYNTAKKEGVKPIIGVEAYMAANSRFDKQVRMGSDQAHLTLLAMNHIGYQNLMQLVSLAHLEGFSYKPRMDQEILEKYSDHLIVLSGCMNSPFNRLLRAGQDDEALALFKWYNERFAGRFYIELQKHEGSSEQDALNTKLLAIAKQLQLPIVATNDVHYVKKGDSVAQDALLCVQTRKLISDTKRMSMLDTPDLYLKSTEEMMRDFHDYPEAITNTVAIAEQCNVEIPTGQLIFPNFPVPQGETADSYFEQMCWQRLEQKFDPVTNEMKERMRYEIDIINQKGYATYFLITQDFVNWAKEQGIGVGPGRGSAAGSLVAFVLGITTIDPFQHGLAFERFLNPQRPTPPDIDMDFADDRRDEVIAYVAKKYGEDHVGHVITFGKMEARVAVRDIGRVLGMPYEEPDKIAKLIPNNPGKKTSLRSAVETVPELTTYYSQPKYKKLIDLAEQVEGSIRHSSVHAAALIITDKPLPDYTPIQQDSKSGKMVTQYDMYALDCNISDDAIGLLKFDFLGLRNLSTIQTTINHIKTITGNDLDINTISLDDTKTFELLSAGDTFGVFQLESAGMRRVARSLKPNQFSDITAMVALYRPGPMDLIPQFIEGKHNPNSVIYPHETLKNVLKETYGVMVYQEQILQIANIMAGYSLGDADILRRAIGKKKKSLLDKNKKRFVDEAIKKGYEKTVAEKVWGFIEAFANYGFNKAHAASYAMIAYQTAYLKANYPVEYMTAVMSVESASSSAQRDEKVARAIEESKAMGIVVLPPDVNRSSDTFTLETDESSLNGYAIRFGLTAIKHVGSSAIENILETRKELGQFVSLTQFIHETDSRKVNKTTLECLIKVGAFDTFGNRASMLENLESIRATATKLTSAVEGQDTLFANTSEHASAPQDTFLETDEYPRAELLHFEKELLGLYLTDHPLSKQLEVASSQANKTVADLDRTIHVGQIFTFGGVLTRVREVTTKKTGKPMAFGTLEDASGSASFVVFPKTYEQYQSLLQSDSVVIMRAKVDERDEELQLIVESITQPNQVELTHTASKLHKEIFIPRKTPQETLTKLGALLKSHPGKHSVVILLPGEGKQQRMVLPYTVEWSKQLEKQIAKLLG
ncbi:MAG: DNA polymerase III subunit alpha [Pseudomonadales bacterium]|nr:DNA polymerase III subunit alpha [Pseudomonadales bacterium]